MSRFSLLALLFLSSMFSFSRQYSLSASFFDSSFTLCRSSSLSYCRLRMISSWTMTFSFKASILNLSVSFYISSFTSKLCLFSVFVLLVSSSSDFLSSYSFLYRLISCMRFYGWTWFNEEVEGNWVTGIGLAWLIESIFWSNSLYIVSACSYLIFSSRMVWSVTSTYSAYSAVVLATVCSKSKMCS